MFAKTFPASIVTGGSRGIGAAISRMLAESGHCVAVVARDRSQGEAFVDSLPPPPLGGSHIFAECDVSNINSIPDVYRSISASFSEMMFESVSETDDDSSGINGNKKTAPVDVLVNCAGTTGTSGPLLRLKDDLIENVISTNLIAPISWSKAVYPAMIRNRRGLIVNIGSIVGDDGNAMQGPYAASKSGLVGLSKSLSKELGGKGVRVNVISPGFIDTDMTSDINPERKELILERIPLRRMGKPEEIAEAVKFLMRCEYVNGQVIRVDGGITL